MQLTTELHPRLKAPGLGPRATENTRVAVVMFRVTGPQENNHQEGGCFEFGGSFAALCN